MYRNTPRGWKMRTQIGFRGMSTAQTEIISYWRSQRLGRDFPCRTEIDPGKIRAHLAAISVVEILSNGHMVFRLIGSKARTLIHRDLPEFPPVTDKPTPPQSWCAGLLDCIDTGGPVGGVEELGLEIRTWLRLPMRSSKQGCFQIMCHDMILDRTSNQVSDAVQSNNLSAAKTSLAA